MATNEIYKYGQWLSFPLPLRGDDPNKNDDPTRNGDPVLIGDTVGFAQEVGGVPMIWPEPGTKSKSTVSFALARNTANSLEPGWASIALVGAFAYPVENWDPMTMGSGTPVGIIAAKPAGGATTFAAAAASDPCGPKGTKAKLIANEPGDHWFGVIVGQTKLPYPVEQTDKQGVWITIPEGTYVPIVNIVQTMEGRKNDVPDKRPAGS